MYLLFSFKFSLSFLGGEGVYFCTYFYKYIYIFNSSCLKTEKNPNKTKQKNKLSTRHPFLVCIISFSFHVTFKIVIFFLQFHTLLFTKNKIKKTIVMSMAPCNTHTHIYIYIYIYICVYVRKRKVDESDT